MLENLNRAHRFVPLSSKVHVCDGFYDDVLRDVLKFSDTLKSNVAPAFVISPSIDLDLIIVGGALKYPLFL